MIHKRSALVSLLVLSVNTAVADPSFTNPDEPTMGFKGVVMLDGSSFDGVYGDGEAQTETQLRRATFGLSAEVSPELDLEFSVQLDEGIDDAGLKDAFLSWKVAKRQRVIAGRQKEPMGLENNQSSKHIPVMERSMMSALFTPDRHTGLSWSIRAPRYSAAIGVFEANDEDGEDAGGDLATSGRATMAVLKNDTQTIHLGASISLRDMDGASVKLKDEGGVNPAENIVASKRRDVDSMQNIGLEAAWLTGALSMQAEWMQTDMQLAEDAPDPTYSGSYIQAAWLFGDARRRYSNGKIKFAGFEGSSAWEAVVRAGWADLRDSDDGTQAETLMAGLNYYYGKQFRVMGGLIKAETSGPDVTDAPSGNAATLRLQYAF